MKWIEFVHKIPICFLKAVCLNQKKIAQDDRELFIVKSISHFNKKNTGIQ